MLIGASLFSGETASEVMAAVLKEEPAWDARRSRSQRRSGLRSASRRAADTARILFVRG
jgi:hypothetical protein